MLCPTRQQTAPDAVLVQVAPNDYELADSRAPFRPGSFGSVSLTSDAQTARQKFLACHMQNVATAKGASDYLRQKANVLFCYKYR